MTMNLDTHLNKLEKLRDVLPHDMIVQYGSPYYVQHTGELFFI